ncbi:response regulator [uncultured Thiodictyon sp.]|uniref:response regulator n=1 Tax=uncultured Thiodictyon sp. TaxID=1846217 RepID=UPI0025F3B9D2|nr:response regulator [uncultured Thiodictyon sp.]
MKILLVDDSKSARYALRLALQRLGVEVELAESAEAAFQVLAGSLPDAILMDHMMPGLSGFEALDVIRADPRTAQIPVVMCTSHEAADFAADARRRGAVGVLPKSMAAERLPDLLSGLQSALDQVLPTVQAVPTPVAQPAAPQVAVSLGVPERTLALDPELVRLIEHRIDACMTGMIEPLMQDLERNLNERLLATTRKLIQSQTEAQAESQAAETRELIAARLADERQAARRLQTEAITAQCQSAVAQLIGEAVSEKVRVGLETERDQIMALVNQCLREFSADGTTAAQRDAERRAALDEVITAKTIETTEVAKREASEAAAGAVAQAQRISDAMMKEVRRRLTWLYVAVVGTLLIGGLIVSVIFYSPH